MLGAFPDSAWEDEEVPIAGPEQTASNLVPYLTARQMVDLPMSAAGAAARAAANTTAATIVKPAMRRTMRPSFSICIHSTLATYFIGVR